MRLGRGGENRAEVIFWKFRGEIHLKGTRRMNGSLLSGLGAGGHLRRHKKTRECT